MKGLGIGPGGALRDVDLTPLNTLRLPARARFMGGFVGPDELRAFALEPPFAGLPRAVLGGGSNVVFRGDYPGLLLRSLDRSIETVGEDGDSILVRLGAGAPWADCVDRLLALGLCGPENLAGVPGTVGGAVSQNIGAYGSEIAEFVREALVWDGTAGVARSLTTEECDYRYRGSLLKDRPELIVMSAVLALPRRFRPRVAYKELAAAFAGRAPERPREVADAVLALRARKLPDPAVLPNAGCFFKNPTLDAAQARRLLTDRPSLVAYRLAGGRFKFAAGRLIEEAGLKGARWGDVGISERHALVLVNHGRADGAAVLEAADRVRREVHRRFGVGLELEPVVLPPLCG